MTTSTLTAPPVLDDLCAAAEAAADRFTEALDRQAAGHSTGLAAALPPLIHALTAVAPPGLVHEVQAAANSALAEYDLNARLLGELHAREQLGDVTRVAPIGLAIAAALVRYDSRAADNADAEVRALEAERRTLLAGIEDAVERADLDEVMRLRGGALVTLPAKIAAAQQRVLEHNVAHAEAVLSRTSARHEPTSTEAQAAASQVERLRKDLNAAEQRHAAAARISQRHSGAAAKARQQLVATQRALAAHQSAALTAERDQVRRLAGLDADAAPVAAAAEAEQLRNERTRVAR